MKWVIVLLGIFWITLGIWGLAATKKLIQVLSNFVKNTRQQMLGVLGLTVGVLLLIAASSVEQSWFVLMIGAMACLKGLAITLLPEAKLKAVIDWWLSAPEVVYKAWAVFLLILGVVVFYVI